MVAFFMREHYFLFTSQQPPPVNPLRCHGCSIRSLKTLPSGLVKRHEQLIFDLTQAKPSQAKPIQSNPNTYEQTTK
jgi:hypothetical protein